MYSWHESDARFDWNNLYYKTIVFYLSVPQGGLSKQKGRKEFPQIDSYKVISVGGNNMPIMTI